MAALNVILRPLDDVAASTVRIAAIDEVDQVVSHIPRTVDIAEIASMRLESLLRVG